LNGLTCHTRQPHLDDNKSWRLLGPWTAMAPWRCHPRESALGNQRSSPGTQPVKKWPAMMTYPDKTHHVTVSTSWWMIMNARSALISHCRNPSCLQQIVAEGIAVLRTIGTAATSFGRLGSKTTEYEVWHAKISRSLHRTQSNHLGWLCQMCGKRSLVAEKKLCTSYQSQLLTLACQNWE